MSPCTVLVERDDASTMPLVWLFEEEPPPVTRSANVVSIRLNPMVCELAMLPEMFSIANACARNPLTALFNAPNMPMDFLLPNWPSRTCGRTSPESPVATAVPVLRQEKRQVSSVT